MNNKCRGGPQSPPKNWIDEKGENMEPIITYLACVCVLLIFGRLFILPIKIIAKLLLNSILGIILLYIINVIGANFAFHIGINWITIAVVGLLGAPGAILLLVLKFLMV